MNDKITYYQWNRERLLKMKQNNIMKIIKKELERWQEINADNYLQKNKFQKESTVAIDTIIFLKKIKKD